MFGDKKSIKDSERSLISETVSIDGTVNSSGAIDVAGLVKGPVYSKEIVIKICSSPPSKRSKYSTFKIIIEGEIPLQFLNNFVSLDVIRDGNTLRMVKYEIIEKIKSEKV